MAFREIFICLFLITLSDCSGTVKISREGLVFGMWSEPVCFNRDGTVWHVCNRNGTDTEICTPTLSRLYVPGHFFCGIQDFQNQIRTVSRSSGNAVCRFSLVPFSLHARLFSMSLTEFDIGELHIVPNESENVLQADVNVVVIRMFFKLRLGAKSWNALWVILFLNGDKLFVFRAIKFKSTVETGNVKVSTKIKFGENQSLRRRVWQCRFNVQVQRKTDSSTCLFRTVHLKATKSRSLWTPMTRYSTW